VTTGPKYRIQESSSDTSRIVTVSGEIDLASAPKLETALVPESDQTVIVDLLEVGFMDSTGLRSLLSARDALEEGGGRLLLVFGEGPVERILELTGLTDRFEHFSSLEAATQAAG
jgi:anti-sigma B factor antagonist